VLLTTVFQKVMAFHHTQN